jgi:NTE family protein
LRALREVEWPERDLLICAVRRRDGSRVVFGQHGSTSPTLDLAVAASCAVPGYFAPVSIDSRRYIDGGVHSPTNAAILRGRGLDLVVIVSPMSGPFGWRPDLYAASRRHAGAILRREVNALHADGIPTLVFSPGPDEQRVMGNDFMSAHRVNEVIQQSFFAAGARASSPNAQPLMQFATRRRDQRRSQTQSRRLAND